MSQRAFDIEPGAYQEATKNWRPFLSAKAAPEAWDPQRRVFAAIEQSRGALGQVEPLTEMERAQIRDCLARVGVPAQAAGVVE